MALGGGVPPPPLLVSSVFAHCNWGTNLSPYIQRSRGEGIPVLTAVTSRAAQAGTPTTTWP